MKYSIKYAVETGLETEEDIDMLVTQIRYRAADLAVLLEIEDKRLSDYSRELRREKSVKYFGDEELQRSKQYADEGRWPSSARLFSSGQNRF